MAADILETDLRTAWGAAVRALNFCENERMLDTRQNLVEIVVQLSQELELRQSMTTTRVDLRAEQLKTDAENAKSHGMLTCPVCGDKQKELNSVGLRGLPVCSAICSGLSYPGHPENAETPPEKTPPPPPPENDQGPEKKQPPPPPGELPDKPESERTPSGYVMPMPDHNRVKRAWYATQAEAEAVQTALWKRNPDLKILATPNAGGVELTWE